MTNTGTNAGRTGSVRASVGSGRDGARETRGSGLRAWQPSAASTVPVAGPSGSGHPAMRVPATGAATPCPPSPGPELAERSCARPGASAVSVVSGPRPELAGAGQPLPDRPGGSLEPRGAHRHGTSTAASVSWLCSRGTTGNGVWGLEKRFGNKGAKGPSDSGRVI